MIARAQCSAGSPCRGDTGNPIREFVLQLRVINHSPPVVALDLRTAGTGERPGRSYLRPPFASRPRRHPRQRSRLSSSRCRLDVCAEYYLFAREGKWRYVTRPAGGDVRILSAIESRIENYANCSAANSARRRSSGLRPAAAVQTRPAVWRRSPSPARSPSPSAFARPPSWRVARPTASSSLPRRHRTTRRTRS